VWIPAVEDMYPTGYQTWVEVTEITKPLEGRVRPGHFRGVTTIVSKLFNASRPDRAYFGQKDAQQSAVIRQMTRDLSYPVQVIICPTLRDDDGLAKSSRNSYLDPIQRQAAVILFKALKAAKDAFEKGERNAERIRHLTEEIISSEPLAKLQYVSCADFETLQELNVINRKAILSLAVFIGKTRLIDNFILG
ncbi:MAG: pantoate--beta-alanine ligase, partial [Chloroflexota bacterium]